MNSYSLYDSNIDLSCDSPDESRSFFHRLCRLLRRNGFVVGPDPRIEKNYKSLTKSHRAGNHSDLKFKAEFFPVGTRFEFYQSLVIENQNGGEYDFDKLKKMPYLVWLRFHWTINLMSEFLQSQGFVRQQRFSDWHADPLRAFNVGWESHNFPRDDTGWVQDEYLRKCGWHRDDDDGVTIHSGQDRFIRINGRYVRVRAYGGINSMWHCLAPGIHRQEHATSLHSTFPGRGRHFEPREQEKTIDRKLKEAVQDRKYLRAHAISLAAQRCKESQP